MTDYAYCDQPHPGGDDEARDWHDRYHRTAIAGGLEPRLLAVKATARGPRPFGGSITATLDDPALDRAIAGGYDIVRTWEVWEINTGGRYSLEVWSAR